MDVDARMHRAGPAAIALAVAALALAGAALALAGASGCFSPRFEACAVACGADEECPSGYFCLGDNRCHTSEDDELCTPGDPDSSMTEVDGSVGDDSGGPGPDADPPDGGDRVDAGPPVRPGPGDLVISEIHKNPTEPTEPNGEWFEVTNLTDSTLELMGLQASDNAGSFVVETTLLVEPRGRVVFGFSANLDNNGGVAVDFAYGGVPTPPQFNNNGAEVLVLVDSARPDDPLDAVEFDTVNFPNTDGRSMSLDPDLLSPDDNDAGSAWCDGQAPFGTGDLGSPGEANPQCPEL